MANNQDESADTSHETGTGVDVLKTACAELFPKFVEAGTTRCAKYVGTFLFDKFLPKTSARRKFRKK
jgi:hypothetical protein